MSDNLTAGHRIVEMPRSSQGKGTVMDNHGPTGDVTGVSQ